MKIIDGNLINIILEERLENVYDVSIWFDMIPYIAVYSVISGFIYSSLEGKDRLKIIEKEIKEMLNKET